MKALLFFGCWNFRFWSVVWPLQALAVLFKVHFYFQPKSFESFLVLQSSLLLIFESTHMCSNVAKREHGENYHLWCARKWNRNCLDSDCVNKKAVFLSSCNPFLRTDIDLDNFDTIMSTCSLSIAWAVYWLVRVCISECPLMCMNQSYLINLLECSFTFKISRRKQEAKGS